MAESGGATQRERGAAAARFWREFDLEGLRQKLDKSEIEISEHVERSVLSRKRLAQDTKAFRKLTDADDKLKKLGPLLRGYQEDIDRLTKRARFAETSFLELYKRLFDAPDPTDLLETLAEDDVDSLREENERLRVELQDYEEEFAALQNQDITIRRLEKELEDLRASSQASLQQALDSKEADLALEAETKAAQAENQARRAQEALEAETARLAELQETLDRSQEEVFQLRTNIEETEAARQAEADIVTEDLARANARIADLELQLRESSTRGASPSSASAPKAAAGDEEHGSLGLSSKDRERVLELEDELVRKGEVEESLRDQIVAMQREAREVALAHESAVKENDKELGRIKDELFRAKAQIKELPTKKAYDQLRRQVELLQAVDIEGEADGRPPSPAGSDANAADSTDGGFNSRVLVLKRIRKLEATAASLRVQLDDEKNARVLAETQRKQAEDDAQDLRNELTQLEEESKASFRRRRSSTDSFKHRSNQFGEERSSGAKRSPQNSIDAANSNSLAAHEAGGTETAANLLLAATEEIDFDAGALENKSNNFNGNGNAASAGSVLSIVQEQRNEFRKRMLELETARDQLASKLSHAEQDQETLRADNVNLLEKIRYLQSYGGGQSSQHAHHEDDESAGRVHPNQRAEVRVNVAAGLQHRSGFGGASAAEMSEARYRQAYENKLNPFSDFSARERRRRLHGLNLAERVTYQAMSFVTANKYTRLGVFVYVLALHVLVFFALSMTTTGGCLDAATPGDTLLMGSPPGNDIAGRVSDFRQPDA
ncbi:Protein CASP [Hondaea fermentalgiana]|uniref:Protein CASP n=1 Tax=Hondaea fermentalgiana TaxID=2315210 RepID=A0A2R5G4I1_9STRA|nr:Protein CASP [Hondaea fermentalgiana]|eukprot:GBG25900.1 Protein CASP [Hondaea fermentalgiana]